MRPGAHQPVNGGLLLKDERRSDRQKVARLAGAGAGAVVPRRRAVGAAVPAIVKLLWTSSHVLVSCGIAATLLALFHLVIEVWRLRFWAQPFVWIGMNAITIYLVSAIANFQRLADRFAGVDVARWLGRWAEFAHSVRWLCCSCSGSRTSSTGGASSCDYKLTAAR